MQELNHEWIAIVLLMVLTVQAAFADEKDRSKIPDRYKWNLADLYASDEEWNTAKELLSKEIGGLAAYKGTLARSPSRLAGCLDLYFQLAQRYSRVYVYASMSSDQDTRVSRYLAMQQEMSQVGATFSAEAAFIEPEILAMDRTVLDGFVKDEKRLDVYRHYLDDIVRRKAHTGSAGEEKIIADAGLMSDAPGTIYNIFSNAEFPYPEVTLSDGKTVRLDPSAFSFHRTLTNRDDRKKVFAAYFSKLNEFRRTYGTQLFSQIKRDMFYQRARNYASTLQSALDANNVPVEVYHSLIGNVNANLATFHRYLKLRQRILGVDQLHYYDLYAPLLSNVDLQYEVEEAQKHVLASLKPLGTDYVETVQKAFNERWIDMYPTEGKQSGAYSNGGAYDVHPYILMNYNGTYNDVSTLIHELGHTMHSYYSNKNQPYVNAQYPIFLAEVASTFNEALLIDHMLKNIKDDEVRLSLLGSYLEGIKGTVFRQTQFAEFELKIHELAEKGEALTGDRFNDLYEEITKNYYGHENGVCIVDDEIKAEWMFIPHFYYNYYVFQYATSFTASQALSEKALAGDQDAVRKYKSFLSAGGSDYPIQLLKTAGVDMTTSEPFDLTMKKMNRVMDEMEAILKKMGK
jgi:oligoendopeptidase F